MVMMMIFLMISCVSKCKQNEADFASFFLNEASSLVTDCLMSSIIVQ